ncbi:class I SAM-dependent methyltransferase [Actinomycetospora callitridis]|uniref:class I SAM-dependent methyltransferase n=1 Tax=Actinomycetospora callitridis TaxID=913944 RepID=UPI0023665285|nr:class I SAM-dependent methyltransferase [Actinomycetospora callitridis]MDD7918257.1 class I SAM-dependent methyltransferase [Actinomycetospora callitridis]
MTTTSTVRHSLDDLLAQFINDLGATAAAGNIVIGDRLGLYRGLDEAGPLTSAELATYASLSERYVREWLRGQAAGGLVSYQPETDQFWLTGPQALALADPNGLQLAGAFQLALACFADLPAIEDTFRTGKGFAWGEHHPDVFTGCERFYRPGYVANLVSEWIPAITGLDDRLTAGSTVADLGCGLGSSTRILARTYPASRIVGFDNHPESIELARRMTHDAGLADRCTYQVAPAQDLPGDGYGLVTTFDCLHDMGDPLAAARRVRVALAPDGVWMIVEPFAGTSVADNLTPVGRIYYSLSSFLCVPHALSEGAADAWGNQAGEEPVADLVEQAGFGGFQRVAETPFNIVYEARP